MLAQATRSAAGVIAGITATIALAGFLSAQIPPHAVLLNPTPSDFEPIIAVDGDMVHACGIQPDSFAGGFVHYSLSVDGGRTWPIREVPIAYAFGKRPTPSRARDGIGAPA